MCGASCREQNWVHTMWVKLHKPPKLCRGDSKEWNAKQHYYFNRSYDRYQMTEDGKQVAEMAKKAFSQGRMGRIENVSFVEST